MTQTERENLVETLKTVKNLCEISIILIEAERYEL
jgi:hypothetical protein